MSYAKSILLTPREREILDAIVAKDDLKSACEFLKISYNAGAQRIHRIRQKYEKAKMLIREYDQYEVRTRASDKKRIYL